MKKLLATLLVAVMIMSCMAVVSFAADVEVYTISAYPYAEMSQFDEDAWEAIDPVAAAYVANFRSITGLNVPNANKTAIFKAVNTTNSYFNSGDGACGVMPATATLTDLVAMPIYVKGAGTSAVKLSYETKYFEFKTVVGNYNPANKDLDESGATGVVEINGFNGAGEDVDDLFLVAFFAIKDGKGDAEGNATSTITFENVKTQNVAGNNATVGNNAMTVALSGLTPGSTEAAKMEAADVAAIEASKLVYAGEDTFANFKAAYGVSDDVAADYTEDMSYVCAFGTVDTTKEADEYGFKLTTSYGKVIKGKAVNVVDGKFGIVFYGADYVLEGATIEAYAIVDGAEI